MKGSTGDGVDQGPYMRQHVRTVRPGERGFTLVELLVVIVVLGILSGIVVFGVARMRSDSDAAACVADVRVVNAAADAYLAVTGTYPGSIADLTAGGYLKAAPGAGAYAFDPGTRTASRTPACGTAPLAAAPTTVALTAADWTVLLGKATLSGTTVDVAVAGENRIGYVRAQAGADVVLTTTATLRAGAGYGVWVRAALQAAAGASGYVFQYDVLYGNTFVLRQVFEGKECTVPLKTAKMPANLDLYAPHKLVLIVAGESLRVSLDDTPVFSLPSIAVAVAASTCKFPLSTGTDIGFRTWGTGTSAVFLDTTLG